MNALWRRFYRFALFILLSAAPCSANDTAAELSLGGLVITRSQDVSLNSEELRISLDQVNVRYEFENVARAPVTLTVAFPLPNINLAEGENIAFPGKDPLNFVDFETRVDGAPTKLAVDQRAYVGNKDVTSLLRDLKVPILPIGSSQWKAQDLPEEARSRLAADGLLIAFGENEKREPLYELGWTVKTSVFRKQTFPINRPVLVEHSYHPIVGMSSDTPLRSALRSKKDMANELERYRREYCVTDDFLSELDRIAGVGQANGAMIRERRVGYVLKTGANWAGPIKHFRLLVERGKGNALVSFCAGNLRPSSPTSLDFTAANFVPDRDLKILFVGRF